MTPSAQIRTYRRRDSAVFRKTDEKWGGLSNMAGGFPIRVNGLLILTSEHLYQACRFPHLLDVQKLILDQASPMAAKMKTKPHRAQSRPDWDDVRVRIMRWCLRVKLARNWEKFASLLVETVDRSIVEESHKDDFWGAKPQEDGTLVGCNVLGRLLMELREELKQPSAKMLQRVAPIPIPDFILIGHPIATVEARNITDDEPDPDLIPTPDCLWGQPSSSGSVPVGTASSSARIVQPGIEATPEPEPVSPQLAAITRTMTIYPLRLIEVDLPIARISTHARREKSIRHGHISTLHIWWARRPLAACRAVILASLWPDPVDLLRWNPDRRKEGVAAGLPAVRPERFLDEAAKQFKVWISRLDLLERDSKLSPEFAKTLRAIAKKPAMLSDPIELRGVLLDFIADFANWDNSTDSLYLETSRALTQAAHEALGGEPGTRPMVIDPFAGGGSIPLEALRVGADAFASDLNPIPVLLNKVVLEYIPKYGQRLADEVRHWGQWIKEEAEKELAEFYPKDAADKKAGTPAATPIAYLWARTVLSEAPGQGDIPVEVPLMRSLWLAKKAGRRRALRWVRDAKGTVKTQTVEVVYQIDGKPTPTRVKRPLLEVFEPKKDSEVEIGTVARGSATCPVTGFTTPVASVRVQLKKRRGGAADSRLFCIVSTRESEQGRFYRLPTSDDDAAFVAAAAELDKRMKHEGGASSQRSQVLTRAGGGTVQTGMSTSGTMSMVPDEPTPLGGGKGAGRAFSQRNYGMDFFADLFTPRQLLALTTLARLVREAGERLKRGETFAIADTETDSEGSEMISEGTDGVFAETKRVFVGTKTPSTGTKRTSAGEETASAARGTSLPPASDRGNGEFSGLTPDSGMDAGLAEAVQACLGITLARLTDRCSSLGRYDPSAKMSGINNTFSRQALSMVWDFGEGPPLSERSGGWSLCCEWVIGVIEETQSWIFGRVCGGAQIERASATTHPMPDDAGSAFITDPPYYDAVPYADLSDYFYVWFKRTLPPGLQTAFSDTLTPKEEECIVDDAKGKDDAFYQKTMGKAMAEGRRVVMPSGIGVVVFAHKSTAGWESQLKAMIDAGWIVTGSWPIDTEMGSRLRAQDSAALASSVHLVVRPRENPDGSVSEGDIGEWREVLAELPKKMQEWMPRLAAEGVVGADAIFACLGPALEIFSRYSRVEKASGEAVPLKEYLVEVWAAVSKEALSLIMQDADTGGLEPDARLTAVWLWTVGGGKSSAAEGGENAEDESEDEDDGSSGKKPKVAGFALEFDAARLIAQGLGIHLDKSESIVEVKGEIARLLSVGERTKFLFGKDATDGGGSVSATSGKAKRKKVEPSLFQGAEEIKAEIIQAEAESAGKLAASKPGATVLDRVHQAMLLFSAGRSEAMKRFLVDDGIGKDGRFWTLAQSLSALYPSGTDEKRWVDGVLARKKGLGF